MTTKHVGYFLKSPALTMLCADRRQSEGSLHFVTSQRPIAVALEKPDFSIENG